MRHVTGYSAGAPYSDFVEKPEMWNSLTAEDLFVPCHPFGYKRELTWTRVTVRPVG
jgi:hypothetical protein